MRVAGGTFDDGVADGASVALPSLRSGTNAELASLPSLPKPTRDVLASNTKIERECGVFVMRPPKIDVGVFVAIIVLITALVLMFFLLR